MGFCMCLVLCVHLVGVVHNWYNSYSSAVLCWIGAECGESAGMHYYYQCTYINDCGSASNMVLTMHTHLLQDALAKEYTKKLGEIPRVYNISDVFIRLDYHIPEKYSLRLEHSKLWIHVHQYACLVWNITVKCESLTREWQLHKPLCKEYKSTHGH